MWLLFIDSWIYGDLTRTLTNPDFHFDQSTLEPMEVSAAILKSYPRNTDDLHILASSSREFCRRIGLCIDYSFFGSKELQLTLIAKFLRGIWLAECTNCLPFLDELASLEDPPFEEIINSGIISELMKEELEYISLRVLSKLIQRGSEEHVSKIVRSGFVSSLDRFLQPLSGKNVVIECYDQLKECVIALKRIANISYLRNHLLQSCEILKVLNTLSTSSDSEIHQIGVDTMKSICCNEKMPPIDFNGVNLYGETAVSMLSSEDHEISNFASEFISLLIRTNRDSALLINYCEVFLLVVLEILCHAPDQQLLPALKLLSYFPECSRDLFTDALYDLETQMAGEINSCLVVLCKYLNNESDNIVLEACKSIGFLLQYFYKEDGVLSLFERRDILIKWVDSVEKLCHVDKVNPVHRKFLLASDDLQKDDVQKLCHDVDEMIKTLCASSVEKMLKV